MNKTKIDWCDMSWNPVTGCLHGCAYCYARGITHRFTTRQKDFARAFEATMQTSNLHVLDSPFYFDGSIDPYPYDFEPTLHKYRLGLPELHKKAANIFVGSMTDLFGDWVPDAWTRQVIDACIAAPQHNYLFLTKNPKGYNAVELPNDDNFWYGTSVTVNAELTRIMDLPLRRKTFLSIEPILEKINLFIGGKLPMRPVDWIIVGAETGNRKTKIRPSRNWLEALVVFCKEQDIPLFMKGSLRETWGSELVQEFPAGMDANIHICKQEK